MFPPLLTVLLLPVSQLLIRLLSSNSHRQSPWVSVYCLAHYAHCASFLELPPLVAVGLSLCLSRQGPEGCLSGGTAVLQLPFPFLRCLAAVARDEEGLALRTSQHRSCFFLHQAHSNCL